MALRSKKIRLKKPLETYSPVGECSRKALDYSPKPTNKVHGVKVDHVPPRKEWTNQNRNMGTPYGKFLCKYDDLENTIDSFTTQDLCFYFREVAKENGVKYHLVFAKDCSIIKRLRETYSAREICGMIEFLFTSEQDYLDKNRLSIGILGSRWVNTIYPDFELWLDDRYFPSGKGNHRMQSRKHEWKNEGEVSTVGVW